MVLLFKFQNSRAILCKYDISARLHDVSCLKESQIPTQIERTNTPLVLLLLHWTSSASPWLFSPPELPCHLLSSCSQPIPLLTSHQQLLDSDGLCAQAKDPDLRSSDWLSLCLVVLLLQHVTNTQLSKHAQGEQSCWAICADSRELQGEGKPNK